MNRKLLTGLELKVMNILWKMEKAFVKELIEAWEESPKPAYNTISTVVRILVEKEYVSHEAFGRSHQYFPLVQQDEYQKRLVKNVLNNVFAGSVSTMISTLVDSEEMGTDELDNLRTMIDNFEE